MSDPLNPSRRQFVQGVAITSLLGPALLNAASKRHIAVIGAGAFGSWTAFHLRRAGARVTLLDAWGPGNSRSSSGGVTRVIRAIYGPDRIYTEMVARAFELWAELERKVGHHLYVPTGALWMMRDPDMPYLEAAIPICEELGFPIDRPGLDEARKRWPQIDFEGVRSVAFERRAGILSARRSCQLLRRELLAAGGAYRAARVEPGDIGEGRMKDLRLNDGTRLEADAYVFACGPWLGQLFPEIIGDRVRPSRQNVLYFGTPAGDERFKSARMPVWVDFGERVVYGLPDVHEHGFKIADDTRGETIDPTTMNRAPDPAAIDQARAFLARRFPALADAPLIESRVCQYENSPDGHLIVDRHPDAENLWLAGGGSGHGFKLSPVVGEMLAAAVLGGDAPPDTFALSRLSGESVEGTQFET